MLTREYPPFVYGGAGVHVDFLDPRAARPGGRRRALPRRAPAGRHRLLRGRSPAGRRQRRPADPGRRPRHGGGRGRRRPGPLPHLVHQPRRPPGQAPVRHPPRPHLPLAGAAAALEGRAARRRLPAVVVGRAHRLRGGRRRDRREPGVEGRRPGQLPRRRSGQGPRDPQRRRHRLLPAGSPRPTCWSASASTSTRPSVVFLGRITRQKGVPHLLRAALRFDPDAQVVLLRRRARHARAGGRDRGGRRPPARDPQRRGVGVRDAAARGGPPGPHPRHGVRVPVDLRAPRHREPGGDGAARRPSWPATWAASPRSWSTARPACSSTTTPSTPSASRATWPTPSTPWWPTPTGRRPWAAPGGERAVREFAWSAVAGRTLDVYQGV